VRAARQAAAGRRAWVAGDVGPLGSFLLPIGTLDFDTAYAAYAAQARVFAQAGADLIIIETMSDIRELKAALIACRDHFTGPIIASMTVTADGRTVTGTDIPSFAVLAEALGADCLGLNCSVGPKHLLPLVRQLVRQTTLPISVKPNRGMPRLSNDQTVYPGTIPEFLRYASAFSRLGVNLIGGCCGTDPSFIRALAGRFKGKRPRQRAAARTLRFSSRTRVVAVQPGSFTIIGERINPTGRKALQAALRAGDFSTVLDDARGQTAAGARLLDVNMGVPGEDERALMARACELVQAQTDLPLCIDSSDSGVLEEGLKQACGRPLVNSVNGERRNLDAVLPLIKRFGAAVIGLCMDSRGIPKTAAGRLRIARRIIMAAKQHGIPRESIIIDTLALSLSAQQEQAKETLAAIRACTRRLKVRTSLGVSNISFGLPRRELINAAFLALARQAGLSFGIINPYHDWKRRDRFARAAIICKDPSCLRYINSCAQAPQPRPSPTSQDAAPADPATALFDAVVNGMKEQAGRLTAALLEAGRPPLEINNQILLPALEEVGRRFDAKSYFLPQVLLAAEAMHAAFGRLKVLLMADELPRVGRILLATVRGDIHDIGKNIVAAVLASHGWEVIDLGKNVRTEDIIRAAQKSTPQLIGLSALMTTTMPEMRNVLTARDEAGLRIPVIVGGAAVTRRFAQDIRAQGYAKDAMEAATVARSLILAKNNA